MDIWDSSSQVPSLKLRLGLVGTYAAFILVNVASSLGWLGPSNAEISAKFEVPLTPAGWAFSIWGLIFLLEGAGVAYALMPAGYEPDGWKQRFVHTVGPGWAASWAAASAWQLAFRLQTPGGMWLALACISAALAAMAWALAGLYRLRRRYGGAGSLLLYAAYFLPTSVNAAWLSVATGVAALITALPKYHAGSPELAAASAAAAAAAVAAGLFVVLRYRDTAYGLTLVWALVAVYEKSEAPLVRHAALAGVAAMCTASLFSVLRRRPSDGYVAVAVEPQAGLRVDGGEP